MQTLNAFRPAAATSMDQATTGSDLTGSFFPEPYNHLVFQRTFNPSTGTIIIDILLWS